MTSQRVKFRETNLVNRDAGDPGRGHSGQRICNKGTEGIVGHHEGVLGCTEVSSITHFFGEDVTRVDGTQDVVDIHLLCLNSVTNVKIFEVNMVHALGDGAPGPVNSPLVVVVETGWASSVREVHVIAPMAEG